jgi:hypothetical protein
MLKVYFIIIENTFKYNFYNEFLLPNGLVASFFFAHHLEKNGPDLQAHVHVGQLMHSAWFSSDPRTRTSDPPLPWERYM